MTTTHERIVALSADLELVAYDAMLPIESVLEQLVALYGFELVKQEGVA